MSYLDFGYLALFEYAAALQNTGMGVKIVFIIRQGMLQNVFFVSYFRKPGSWLPI